MISNVILLIFFFCIVDWSLTSFQAPLTAMGRKGVKRVADIGEIKVVFNVYSTPSRAFLTSICYCLKKGSAVVEGIEIE